MHAPDITELRNHLHYDPDTGLFTWLLPRRGRQMNKPAGSYNNQGYCLIGWQYTHILAHRVAFALMTGDWTQHEIDHIDGKSSNNKWSNLRDISHSHNIQNIPFIRPSNKTGYPGVFKRGERWSAQIYLNHQFVHLGHYATPDEAFLVYWFAKNKLHPYRRVSAAT